MFVLKKLTEPTKRNSFFFLFFNIFVFEAESYHTVAGIEFGNCKESLCFERQPEKYELIY